MSFEIQYDAELGVIRAVFTGRVTMQTVRDYLAALLPVIEQSGCRRLISDCLGAEIHFSSIDIMQFPRLAAASPLTRELKRAVVAAPGTSGFDMYETMSNLQGQCLKIFSDRAEAMVWLMRD